MRAAVVAKPAPIAQSPLKMLDLPQPQPGPGQVLLKVHACGVCRTDLHIVEGDLPAQRSPVIPGHQIAGEVAASNLDSVKVGARMGVSWIGATDGSCDFCRSGRENLCDHPTYTGYSRDGGYAEYAVADAAFLVPLPPGLDDLHAAPLLCAGIIGFRSLRVAEVRPGQRVGLFGFGSSASLAIKVLQAWDCKVYVATRDAAHQQLAREMEAVWVGGATEVPPEGLDAAITFAPAGDVVIAALKSLRKGGIVAINAIHLDRIPQFDYDTLLWGERQLRSVTNMTRQDARDFLEVAEKIKLSPKVNSFSLEEANEALLSLRKDEISGSAVLVP